MNLKKVFKKRLILLTHILLLCIIITSACSSGRTTYAPEKTGSIIINTPGSSEPSFSNSPIVTSKPTEEPIQDLTYTDISILNVGDLMIHNTQLNSAYDSATGIYDFNEYFKYIKDSVSQADFSIVNFETTLSNQTQYSGNPWNFNAPLSILDALKTAGFDMLLYANNHCYDYKKAGFLATLNQFEVYGFEYLGAKKDVSLKSYTVKEIKGVKIGLMNYADTLTQPNGQYNTINGKTIDDGCDELMDIYIRGKEDALYSEVSARITEMKNQGAELIIMYIHWGDEYKLNPVTSQTKVAQTLCNLGVDVIIGSHPHVIEPMEILTSQSDPNHSTVCFYSLGNFVSNQNRLSFQDLDPVVRPYTENGLTVTLNIRKYSTGDVFVKSIEYIPTWVHRFTANDGYYSYNIVPLNNALTDPALYGLYSSDFGVNHATAAFNMTDTVFNAAISSFNSKMAEELTAFSQSYYADLQ